MTAATLSHNSDTSTHVIDGDTTDTHTTTSSNGTSTTDKKDETATGTTTGTSTDVLTGSNIVDGTTITDTKNDGTTTVASTTTFHGSDDVDKVIDTTDSYVTEILGRNSSEVDLAQKFIDLFVNVDNEIIDSLEPLFLQIF